MIVILHIMKTMIVQDAQLKHFILVQPFQRGFTLAIAASTAVGPAVRSQLILFAIQSMTVQLRICLYIYVKKTTCLDRDQWVFTALDRITYSSSVQNANKLQVVGSR